MDKPTCATCPYYDRVDSTCRRNSPRPIVGDIGDAAWPMVDKIGDWCGEHPDFPKWIESQRPPKEKPVVIVGFPEDLEAARKLLAQHGFNVPPQDCTAPPE